MKFEELTPGMLVFKLNKHSGSKMRGTVEKLNPDKGTVTVSWLAPRGTSTFKASVNPENLQPLTEDLYSDRNTKPCARCGKPVIEEFSEKLLLTGGADDDGWYFPRFCKDCQEVRESKSETN